MKISKNQLRQIVSEGFKFSSDRFGFMGQGFQGGPNTHDPYAKYRLQEDETKSLPDEDIEVLRTVGDIIVYVDNNLSPYHPIRDEVKITY